MARHPNAVWVPSPNIGYPRGARGQVTPLAKVYHIAAGTLAGMDSWFSQTVSQASAHFGIGKNGELHQYADTLDACYHAGIMQRPDLSVPIIKHWWNNNLNPNRFTIGIEHAGYPGDIPTAAMWKTSVELSLWLDQVHPSLGDTMGEHLRHSQIDSVDRPNDPGPNWDINQLWEDHHAMPLTDDQINNIIMSELTPDLIDMDAALTRMNLKLANAGFAKLEAIKTGGKPAMTALLKEIPNLRAQAEYADYLKAVTSLEAKLRFFGA